MKKLLSLVLLAGGCVGSMIAGTAISFHIGNLSTTSTNPAVKGEKNQSLAFIRLPEPGNPNRPSVAASENQTISFIRLPEPGNPNRPS